VCEGDFTGKTQKKSKNGGPFHCGDGEETHVGKKNHNKEKPSIKKKKTQGPKNDTRREWRELHDKKETPTRKKKSV